MSSVQKNYIQVADIVGCVSNQVAYGGINECCFEKAATAFEMLPLTSSEYTRFQRQLRSAKRFAATGQGRIAAEILQKISVALRKESMEW